MSKTEEQLKKEYQQYVDDFDPTPLEYGDDYLYMMDYDTWLDEYEA